MVSKREDIIFEPRKTSNWGKRSLDIESLNPLPPHWGCPHKYAPISVYMRDTLHWLCGAFFYRVAVLVWQCLLGIAPVYLQELFWWQTRIVLLVNTSNMQRRAFPAVALSIWNLLSLQIRLLPKSYTPLLYKLLKTALFSPWLENMGAPRRIGSK